MKNTFILKETIEYGKHLNLDIIMVKDDRYVACKWEEKKYAEKYGFTFVGTVAQLAKKIRR